MKFLSRLCFLTLLIFVLQACESNRWEADIESNELDLEFERFELDLFEKADDGFDLQDVNELKDVYPQLLPLYSQAIMRFGNLNDPATVQTFQQFTSDENILDLLSEVKTKYPKDDLKEELELLKIGLLRFQFHFPDRSIPKVKSMISAFTYSTVVDDSLLVIGLDNYLGKEFELYPQAGIPKYKFSHFSREYLVSDALKAWLTTELPSDAAQNLLEQMIYKGKVTYLISAFLPELEEHLYLDYSANELAWCEENATEIWSHFLEFELLFNTENHTIRKYMGDSPFIPGFPKGSPGRIGEWLGHEIVKEFMERNKSTSLEQLMKETDANRILRESKYKPD